VLVWLIGTPAQSRALSRSNRPLVFSFTLIR
jgi:hypothetical protein